MASTKDLKEMRLQLEVEKKRFLDQHLCELDLLERDTDMSIYCGEILGYSFNYVEGGKSYWAKK